MASFEKAGSFSLAHVVSACEGTLKVLLTLIYKFLDNIHKTLQELTSNLISNQVASSSRNEFCLIFQSLSRILAAVVTPKQCQNQAGVVFTQLFVLTGSPEFVQQQCLHNFFAQLLPPPSSSRSNEPS